MGTRHEGSKRMESTQRTAALSIATSDAGHNGYDPHTNTSRQKDHTQYTTMKTVKNLGKLNERPVLIPGNKNRQAKRRRCSG